MLHQNYRNPTCYPLYAMLSSCQRQIAALGPGVVYFLLAVNSNIFGSRTGLLFMIWRLIEMRVSSKHIRWFAPRVLAWLSSHFVISSIPFLFTSLSSHFGVFPLRAFLTSSLPHVVVSADRSLVTSSSSLAWL